jgi:hypothetical protein
VNLDLEWMYGPEPQQSKYSPELLRAESLGLQSGNFPLVLARVQNTTSEAQKAKAERTRWGTMLVHEIRCSITVSPLPESIVDFGYGLDDCHVFNYWQDDYPLRASNEQVKTLLLRRKGQAFIAVCTWNPEPETVTLALDSEALGLDLRQAENAETGEALPFDNNTLTLALPGYGVRLVRLK